MERLAYLIRSHFPQLFRGVESVARVVTGWRFARRRHRALMTARITGSVGALPAEMRPLQVGQVGLLGEFLSNLPVEYLRFFQPHGFEYDALERVLRSRAYMTYGLYVAGELQAYALLKLSPTGSAFIGRLVAPALAGRGIGRFLAKYLYWQAALVGLRARSTISRKNAPSIRSHQAVTQFRVVAELPNDYLLIEFPPVDTEPPTLNS